MPNGPAEGVSSTVLLIAQDPIDDTRPLVLRDGVHDDDDKLALAVDRAPAELDPHQWVDVLTDQREDAGIVD